MRSPKTFQREPTTIEAIQWTGENRDAIGDFGATVEHYGGTLRLFVQANQAWLPLEVGEWIARDEHGYYPIKDGGQVPQNYREVHSRTTRVRCDKCASDHHVTVTSSGCPTENEWDTLLVEQLRRLGWRCGKEPIAHHQRISPDVCPECSDRLTFT